MATNIPILGLRTVIYGVDDIQKAKAWYEAALGTKPYFDQPYYVGFTVGGAELGLDPNATPTGTISAGVIAYWLVEDIHMKFNELIALGAKEHEKPHDVGDGIQTAIVVDPFNNLFGLVYTPSKK